MQSSVEGLHQATFRKGAGEPRIPGVLGGSMVFKDPSPRLAQSRSEYAAQLIAPSHIGSLIWRLRGGESQYSLARRSGVGQKVITTLENGKSSATLPVLEQLYTALGGHAFYLAFFNQHPDQTSSLPMLVIAPRDYSKKVGAFFREQRLKRRFSQENIAQMVGETKQGAMSVFENGGPQQKIATIERNFRALRIAATYCGIQPL